MKKTPKKIMAILLAAAMTAALAGCGNSSSNSSSSSGGSSADGTQTAGGSSSEGESTGDGSSSLSGSIDIWAWGGGDEATSREEAIKIFIEGHPELDVTYTVIPTADSVWDQKAAAALSSGSAGDVMQMSPDYYGMNTKYYIDLNPYVEAEGVNLDDVLVPGVIDGYYDTDGKLEGFPLLANCFVMAYNKDMFDQAGIAYPEQGWTMADLADWGTAFAGGSGANQTYAIAKHWVMNNIMLYAGGGTPYSDDLSTSNMGSSEIVDALTLYKELIEKGVMPDSTTQSAMPAETFFISGKCALYPCGGFETITVTNDAEENGVNIGFCPMPSGKDGNEINIQYATGWAVTTTSNNPDAGWQFLKESAYANDAMAEKTAIAGMPVNKNVAENYYKNITFAGEGLDNSYYVDHMGYTHLNPFGGTLSSSGDIWSEMVDRVLSDNEDPQTVVNENSPRIANEFASYEFNN